jgi:multicomponent Na+:H+ antiporter subunit B
MTHHLVLRVVTKLMLPFILVFALYVQAHGESSPGGGFQAGIIVAAAIILYALVFGLSAARQVFPPRTVQVCAALGVAFYAAVGFASLFGGGAFLDYSVFGAAHGQALGIFLIELGVGVTVAAVPTAIFYAYAGREPALGQDREW